MTLSLNQSQVTLLLEVKFLLEEILSKEWEKGLLSKDLVREETMT